MEITLYTGENKNQTEYFTLFFENLIIHYEINPCYLGYKINLCVTDDELKKISSYICRFIFDFYLKEAVITKVYDEYPGFNTEDASVILSVLSDKIESTPLNDDILSILKNKHSLNPESYFVFNMKSIMICIYALTDDVCRSLILSKEKEKLVSIVQQFSNLSFNKCQRADVEFSQDNKCRVSFDESPFSDVTNDELLSLLVQNAPDNVNIINSDLSPELADIVYEIFNFQKNK